MKTVIVAVKMSVHDGYTLAELRNRVYSLVANNSTLGYFASSLKVSAHYDRSISPRKRKRK